MIYHQVLEVFGFQMLQCEKNVLELMKYDICGINEYSKILQGQDSDDDAS